MGRNLAKASPLPPCLMLVPGDLHLLGLSTGVRPTGEGHDGRESETGEQVCNDLLLSQKCIKQTLRDTMC